jgi:hypothetical protein
VPICTAPSLSSKRTRSIPHSRCFCLKAVHKQLFVFFDTNWYPPISTIAYISSVNYFIRQREIVNIRLLSCRKHWTAKVYNFDHCKRFIFLFFYSIPRNNCYICWSYLRDPI